MLALVSAGCGDPIPPPPPPSFEQKLVARLQTCGVLGEGEANLPLTQALLDSNIGALASLGPNLANRPNFETLRNLRDCDDCTACYFECELNADCASVKMLRCGSGLDRISDSLLACYQECSARLAPSSQEMIALFNCSDGTVIEADETCDGLTDCPDGSDEFECPASEVFTCANGAVILANLECSGAPQCSDGSDEHQACAEWCPAPD